MSVLHVLLLRWAWRARLACLRRLRSSSELATVAAPSAEARTGRVADRQSRTPRAAPVFSSDIAPLLDQYCLHCHDSAAAQGGVVLDVFRDGPPTRNIDHSCSAWPTTCEHENMPPEGEPRPNDRGARDHQFLARHGATRGQTAVRGRVAIRRLNRAEYNNTIRDLIGLDLHPADEFPSDDVGYGFDNIGEVLSTPPVLLEMYLAAAEKVIGEAFRSDAVRERLMNPPADTVPRAFRKYTPPVRSPREDKTFRTVPAAPDPELARQQHIYNILLAFCDRAFRRPATHDEVTRLLGIVLSAEKDGERPESALQLALRAVLVSPHFLFLQNQHRSRPGLDRRFRADQ